MGGTPGADAGSACAECLRRSWLIARLGPWIHNVVDHRKGQTTPELLRLPDEELVDAVAAKRSDEFLTWSQTLSEGEMNSALEEADCWACCRHDANFPEGLADGADSPVALIGSGDGQKLREVCLENSVTVVGARRATGYGLEVASSLGRELAAAGLNVISGMALGIDGAVHRGAIERGFTIAVLGCGPDRPYPTSHARLYNRIVETGLVLSEVPPGADAWRWSFPARNRIMAALSAITVVVEAAPKSGSLITAEMAADAGREVGAVPGPVTAAVSGGTNELLANGAMVVRSGQDVLDRMLGVGNAKPMFGPEVTQDEIVVLEAVEGGCSTADEICARTGIEASHLARDLARLEMAGYLRGSITGSWARTTLAAYPSAGE